MKRRKSGRSQAAHEVVVSTVVSDFLERLKFEGRFHRFVLTLELNKIEALHQNYDRPTIFVKTLDEDGLVVQFTKNPLYGDAVPSPRDLIPTDEMDLLIEKLPTQKMLDALDVMIVTGQIEAMCLSQLSLPEQAATVPVLGKQFNELGIPSAYRMNWPATFVDDVTPVV